MSDQILVDVDDLVDIVLLVCEGHAELCDYPLGFRGSASLRRATDMLNAILDRVDHEVIPGALERLETRLGARAEVTP